MNIRFQWLATPTEAFTGQVTNHFAFSQWVTMTSSTYYHGKCHISKCQGDLEVCQEDDENKVDTYVVWYLSANTFNHVTFCPMDVTTHLETHFDCLLVFVVWINSFSSISV